MTAGEEGHVNKEAGPFSLMTEASLKLASPAERIVSVISIPVSCGSESIKGAEREHGL